MRLSESAVFEGAELCTSVLSVVYGWDALASRAELRERISFFARRMVSTGCVRSGLQSALPQMSPTVYPLGNGSSESRTYWAMPVIQARPLMVGITAG